MKVYTKKGIWNSFIMNAYALFMMILFSISTPIYSIKLLIDRNPEFIGGIILCVAVIYFDVRLFAKSGKMRMTLVQKNIENYKGKQICQMIFTISKTNTKKISLKPVYCYTIGNNDLILNNDYIVTISWFNGLAKQVDNLEIKDQ